MSPAKASAPPFLPAYPPWYARTTGWVIVATVTAAAVLALTIEFPVALASRFRLVAELEGELRLPQSAFPDLRPGQRVALDYDALPLARWGIRSGWLRSVEREITDELLTARFAVEPVTVRTAGGERSLGPGATGTARIILGRHTLLQRALAPLRTMRARWGGRSQQP